MKERKKHGSVISCFMKGWDGAMWPFSPPLVADLIRGPASMRCELISTYCVTDLKKFQTSINTCVVFLPNKLYQLHECCSILLFQFTRMKCNYSKRKELKCVLCVCARVSVSCGELRK